MMKKKLVCSLLILLLLADLGYSFFQHLGQPLDGDMAWHIVPAVDAWPILDNPLGTGVILHNQSYPNPNRFFSHYPMKVYFGVMPLFLQRFAQPIDSIYLSCAIVKTFIQLILILLLAGIITGSFRFFSVDFLLAAVLVTPFFQTNGYQTYMGIIDRTPTYVFFYAFPMALLMLYFTPFILREFHKKKPVCGPWIAILWIPLALVVTLSGPLNPGIVLVASFLLFCNTLLRNYKHSGGSVVLKRMADAVAGIPRNYWLFLLPACLLSLYSLYIGMNNSNNIHTPLKILYSRLPAGVFYPLTTKLGLPLLIGLIVANTLLIRKKARTAEGERILGIARWIGLFALVYIILLPLGGSRGNRPNVIRYDTLLPVTMSLVFLFGITTLFLLKNLPRGKRKWYIPLVCGVLLLYTLNDEASFGKNNCQRAALLEISRATSGAVKVPGDCLVLTWRKIDKPEESDLEAQLLRMWGVTKEKRLFFNE